MVHVSSVLTLPNLRVLFKTFKVRLVEQISAWRVNFCFRMVNVVCVLRFRGLKMEVKGVGQIRAMIDRNYCLTACVKTAMTISELNKVEKNVDLIAADQGRCY